MTEVAAHSRSSERAGRPTWARALWAHGYFYSRTWKGSVTTSFLFPVLYLAAMGVGLGTLVDHHTHTVGGVRYLDFLAPGLLAGTILQVSVNESTYPVMARIKWIRSYWAMLATPLSVRDVLIGHLGWAVIRGAMVSSIFLLVMACFGAVHSALVVLVIPVAMLAALAFASPTTAFAATTSKENGFALLYRFGVIPLFLFSATFFPLGQLPAAVRYLAQLTPLLHAVNLVRGLTLGHLVAAQNFFDLAYLVGFAMVGCALADRAFKKRLVV